MFYAPFELSSNVHLVNIARGCHVECEQCHILSVLSLKPARLRDTGKRSNDVRPSFGTMINLSGYRADAPSDVAILQQFN